MRTGRGTGLAASVSIAALLAMSAIPAQADTLQQALTEAYSNNPTLSAARADQRATDEGVPIAKAAGRPSASVDSQYLEYVKQSSSSYISPDRSVGAQLNLSVPIYSGGAVRNGVHGAEERVLAGQANLRATESSIFSQVVAAYMDVLRNEAIVGLQKNQVDVLNVNLNATSDRFQIGDLTRTDVAQSQSRLAVAQSDLSTAQSNLIAARETYTRLTGSAPNDLQPPPPLPGLPDNVAEALATALDSNPDLLAARKSAKAAGYDVKAAGAGHLPKVSVITGGTYNNYLGSLTGGGLGAVPLPQTSTAVQVGVQLSLPLFQGGLPAARERQAQARSSAALEQVVATERQVVSQVRSAWSSWQAANAVITSSKAAVDSASLSLEGVRAENSIGNRTVLDVLNAEQELVNARVQLVTARRNAYVAAFTLLAAMGKAEARDLGLEGEGLLYDPMTNYDRVKGKWFDWSHDRDPTTQTKGTADIPPATADIPSADETPDKSGY
ncbi:TolC family outer membrane protein [Porphyrobacter algicida]|uniref:TolC family outer membrane protein n=1 Tax=Qipengyuania algicida TaxID=1836209 RepID=A0A845AM08_9SPHN|nr:TolC family outer membrane protein [Qipengyuania algicida]MXP28048.1 TolC family outer membrane protein [Qipengyuania algicida]